MVIEFSDWLINEMRDRDLSQSDLARLSHMSQSQISMVITGGRKPGNDFILSIAKAFRMPPETVFRAAGILPPIDEDAELNAQISHLVANLTPDRRAEVIKYIRFIIIEEKEHEEGKKNGRNAARVAKTQPSQS